MDSASFRDVQGRAAANNCKITAERGVEALSSTDFVVHRL
jgi:hypothetical protein